MQRLTGPNANLTENLWKAGFCPGNLVELRICDEAGVDIRSYTTKPVLDVDLDLRWRKALWIPMWAAVIIRFHRREKEVTKHPGPGCGQFVAEVGYKEMIVLLKKYMADPDSITAVLAAAALSENPGVAAMAKQALELPLHGLDPPPPLEERE